MKIVFDNKSKEYILKKGGIITIIKEQSGNCWASIPVPQVRLGQPEIKERYNYFEEDGIKVYIVKSLEPKGDNIRIGLNSFLGFKSFDISGFKVL